MAILSIAGFNFSLFNLNIFELQGSIIKDADPTSHHRIRELKKVIKSSRDYHRLYDLNRGTRGKVLRFAQTVLNDGETDALITSIKNQRGPFKRFQVWGLYNYERFLMKSSEECYCDPFDPEPNVYNGYMIFSEENLNEIITPERANSLDQSRKLSAFGKDVVSASEIGGFKLMNTRKERAQNTFRVGKLDFEILANNQVTVKMQKRFTFGLMCASRTFQLKDNDTVLKFKNIMSFLIKKNGTVVNANARPVGRLWHSYSLDQFFNQVNSDNMVFTYYNSSIDIMVAAEASTGLNSLKNQLV